MTSVRGIGPITAFVIIAVTAIIAATIAYIYTVNVNQSGIISTGSEMIAKTAVTFSGKFDKGSVDVPLSNGMYTRVNWDGKAVGVVALMGNYLIVKGYKYYLTLTASYGLKAANECPFTAPITGATLYDVDIKKSRTGRPLFDISVNGTFGTQYVELQWSSQLASTLQSLNVKYHVGTVNNNYVIRIPITLYKYELWGKFIFYYGQTGWWGGCPTLSPHHESRATTELFLLMNG